MILWLMKNVKSNTSEAFAICAAYFNWEASVGHQVKPIFSATQQDITKGLSNTTSEDQKLVLKLN